MIIIERKVFKEIFCPVYNTKSKTYKKRHNADT